MSSYELHCKVCFIGLTCGPQQSHSVVIQGVFKAALIYIFILTTDQTDYV